MNVISRDNYLNKLIARMGNGSIKAITGIRKCGKSFLLFTLFKEYLLGIGVKEDHILEMPFDDFKNEEYRDSLKFRQWLDNSLKDKDTYYLFLDEIQLLDDFSETLCGLAYISNLDIYVTGSNAKGLTSDIITEFRGRADIIHLYPLSFKEFISAYPTYDINTLIDLYLTYGGLPRITQYEESKDKIDYLNDTFNETYIRDIKDRYHLEDENDINALIDTLASSVGSLVNPHNLSELLESKNEGDKSLYDRKINTYISYLTDSYILEKVDSYDLRGKKYFNHQNKYYFVDIGLRNARLNFRQLLEGHTLENVVYNQLRERGYSVDFGRVPTYSKNKNGETIYQVLEVDFVARETKKEYYIQLCDTLFDKDKYESETKSLKKINSSFKKILIVRYGISETHYSEDGILLLKLSDFLMDDKSLDY